MLSEANAQSFCGTLPVADPSEAPINRWWSILFEHPKSNSHERGREVGRQDNSMRKLIYAINITLDGCCDHTKTIPDEEVGEYFTQLIRDDVDLFIYGRKTHQLMVPYWPDEAKKPSATKADKEFADTFNSINKIVFSRSLESAEGNTRIVRSNLRDEILKLKQEPGKNILVGGVDIPSQLIELGLVDEYRFVVQPILAGEGRRLLEGVSLPEKLQLRLVESKFFKSGGVALVYLKQ
jgi:dihydrofolate reductase